MYHAMSKKSLFKLEPAWLSISGFAIVTAICCLVPLGAVASLVVPLLSIAVAGFLYFRCPSLYLGFVWWLWFLTPLIRRMIDFRSGYTEPSPILLSPLLASAFTSITFFRSASRSQRYGVLPFVFAIASVGYGFCIGMVQNGSFQSVALKGLEFIIPLLLGFHIYINWQHYPFIRQNTQRCFYWGALVMGLYGLLQFILAPGWDQAWLINVTSKNVAEVGSSFGIPKPLGIRVWSTSNSPLDFSMLMSAALLVSLTSKESLRIPVFGVGFLAFMLAQARTAWLGFFTALLITIVSLKSSLQIRLFILLFAISLSIVPLLTIEPFASVISSRLNTLANIGSDASGSTRLGTYQMLIVPALTSFIGYGVGNVPNFGPILDSSILWVLFSLGLFGSICYFGGWLVLLSKTIGCEHIKHDSFAVAARAIAISAIPTMILGPVVWSTSGVTIWSFLGIAAAATRYYSSIAHKNSQESIITQKRSSNQI